MTEHYPRYRVDFPAAHKTPLPVFNSPLRTDRAWCVQLYVSEQWMTLEWACDITADEADEVYLRELPRSGIDRLRIVPAPTYSANL